MNHAPLEWIAINGFTTAIEEINAFCQRRNGTFETGAQ